MIALIIVIITSSAPFLRGAFERPYYGALASAPIGNRNSNRNNNNSDSDSDSSSASDSDSDSNSNNNSNGRLAQRGACKAPAVSGRLARGPIHGHLCKAPAVSERLEQLSAACKRRY